MAYFHTSRIQYVDIAHGFRSGRSYTSAVPKCTGVEIANYMHCCTGANVPYILLCQNIKHKRDSIDSHPHPKYWEYVCIKG